LGYSGDKIIAGLEVTVQLLDQFGKGMIGNSSLDLHRLE
jgi:hypothetical protein